MTQDANVAIRRHADGSIDTAYYLARGRRERSRQAHHLFGAVCRSARRILSTLNRHLNVAGPTRDLRHRTQPDLG